MVRSTAIYSISVFASRLAGFVLLPVYTRYLTPSDYGVLELLELTSFIFGTLIGMRFGDSLFYYYSAANTRASKDNIVGTAFLGAFLAGCVALLLGWASAPYLAVLVLGSSEYTLFFRLVFVSMSFSFLQEVGLCYMRVLDRPGAYVIASLSRLILNILLSVTLLVYVGMGLAAVLWGGLITSAVVSIWLALYSLRGISLSIDTGLCFRMLRYSLPLALGGLAMFVINFGDRFILSQWVSLAEIGIYALAYKMGMLISYVQMPFDIYWRSQVFSLIRRDDGEIIYVRTCTYLALTLTFLAVLLTLFIEPLLRIMVGPDFFAAAAFVPWIAAAYVIRTIAAHFRTIFLTEDRTEKEAQVTWTGALFCLAAYTVLIPLFRLWGAVAATSLAFSVMFVFSFWKAQRVRLFTFEYRRLALIVLVASATAMGFYLTRPESLWLQLALGTLFAGLYPVALLLFDFFHADEKLVIAGFWKRVAARRFMFRQQGAL